MNSNIVNKLLLFACIGLQYQKIVHMK